MAETRPSLPDLGAGRRVSPEEIRDVLADEGYSAGARKAWLKTVLTALQEGDDSGAKTERGRLIEEINAVIDDSQDDAADERRRPGDVL